MTSEKQKKRIYKIPCDWMMYGLYEIEAESLGKAIEIAYEKGRPKNQEYISDSFRVEEDNLEDVNEDNPEVIKEIRNS